MIKKISIIFTGLAIALVSSLGSVSLVEKKNFELISEATAAAGNCEGSIEIQAGGPGPITASYYNYFTGMCQPGTIDGYGPAGLSFNQQYMYDDWCSNGWNVPHYETTAYDATSVNISTPYTFVATVYGYADNGGGCDMVYDSVEITVLPDLQPDFTMNCTPASTTITRGSSTSFNISTTSQDGFNSAVTISHSLSPNSGTLPTVSYTNNGQAPSAVTTANITTTSSTTAAAYTITFTGNGGGKSHSCNVSLIVNEPPPPAGTYSLSLSPVSADVIKGNNIQFTVTATCTGGLPGPIYNLSASSAFTNLTYTFSSTTVACGSSVTLTVGNTGAIGAGEYSTPQSRLGQSLTVTGSGQ